MQARDKEISIRQIVEDERSIIETRFKKDLQALTDQNQKELKHIASQGTEVRNKNEKL